MAMAISLSTTTTQTTAQATGGGGVRGSSLTGLHNFSLWQEPPLLVQRGRANLQ